MIASSVPCLLAQMLAQSIWLDIVQQCKFACRSSPNLTQTFAHSHRFASPTLVNPLIMVKPLRWIDLAILNEAFRSVYATSNCCLKVRPGLITVVQLWYGRYDAAWLLYYPKFGLRVLVSSDVVNTATKWLLFII